jgi:hypothetical protein
VLICEAFESHTQVIEHDLDTGEERDLIRIEDHLEYLWIDLPLAGDRLIYTTPTSLMMIDLAGTAPQKREIVRVDLGMHTHNLPSISADGKRALLGQANQTSNGFVMVDVETGRELHRMQWDWYANHFHFSPFDASWVGFCHEGPTENIPDRVQIWHAQYAPQGRCIFDQEPDAQGVRLCVGHERWNYHEVSALAVAYGVSPHGPRGLWKLDPQGPARLISEANRDWHCNISRDGRYAVVDTTGPYDLPGCGWENHQNISDILLVDMRTGQRTHLARTKLGAKQHCHPHPAFSPDGRWIVFNECAERSDRGERSTVRFIKL